MDGALMEVGPYRLKDDHTLEYNKGSWDEFANLLFVDQPIGTGFSYVNTDSYIHELPEMSAQFMVFLEKFFQLFPEYERDDVSGRVLHLRTSTLKKWIADGITDLHSWRILRGHVYPPHRHSHPDAQQGR
jgi:hypothetical protein